MQRESILEASREGKIGPGETTAYYLLTKPADILAGLVTLPLSYETFAESESARGRVADLGSFIASGIASFAGHTGSVAGEFSVERSGANIAKSADVLEDWALIMSMARKPAKTTTGSQTRLRILENIEESAKARASSGFEKASRRWKATEFYKDAGWPKEKIMQHLRGIDFNKPVEIVRVPEGKRLIQYQLPDSPQGSYYAEPGTPAYGLGIYTSGLIEKSFKVSESTFALKSTAAEMTIDWFSDLPWEIKAPGGNYQLFIPKKNGIISAR
jgi:hypothetical protein